jgi:hypothetical protein
MTKYAALDVSMEQTAICVVDANGKKIAEDKVPTDPDAIADWLAGKAGELERIGMETGPLAVWLWNELTTRGLPIVCLDARRQADANPPLRGGQRDPDATGWLLFPEGLGPADRQGRRLQEGEGRGGAQACRHPPRRVEDERAVPLRRRCSLRRSFRPCPSPVPEMRPAGTLRG